MCTLLLVFLLVTKIVGENMTDLCKNTSCFCTVEKDETDFLRIDIDCSLNESLALKKDDFIPEGANILNLSANNLTSLGNFTGVFKSDSLTELYLNRNQLREISDDVLKLPALRILDLSDNLLSQIDANTFKRLGALTYLNLASNHFKQFTPGVFKDLNLLQVLILDDNDLGEYLNQNDIFQADGPHLNAKIEALSMENVNLRDARDNFLSDAYNLRHLRMSRNSLTVLPELPFTLQHLDASDNPIVEIDSENFSNNPALEELLLNHLNIKEVPAYTFASLKSLQTLELKGNRDLSVFDTLAFGDEVLDDSDDFVLRVLSLRGSGLTTLGEALMEPFSRLQELDLQGNPWLCDCRLKWIKRLNMTEEFTDHIRCFRPLRLMNERLFDVQDNEMQCPLGRAFYQRVGAYITMSAVIVLFCAAVWVFVVVPRGYSRRLLLQSEVTPNSPYSRITIEPNAAEDYR